MFKFASRTLGTIESTDVISPDRNKSEREREKKFHEHHRHFITFNVNGLTFSTTITHIHNENQMKKK